MSDENAEDVFIVFISSVQCVNHTESEEQKRSRLIPTALVM